MAAFSFVNPIISRMDHRSFMSRPRTLLRAAIGAASIALLLAACGRADEDAAAGGLTVGEVDRLEAAADRLDARPPSPMAARSAELEAEISERIEREKAAISAQ